MQDTVLNSDSQCVPLYKALKLLRISTVNTVCADLHKYGLSTPSDYTVERDFNNCNTRKKPLHKRTKMTLEAFESMCAWIYSRRAYNERTWRRAEMCGSFVRDIRQRMSDTLYAVKDVLVLQRLRGKCNFTTKEITSLVTKLRETHSAAQTAYDIVETLETAHEVLAAVSVEHGFTVLDVCMEVHTARFESADVLRDQGPAFIISRLLTKKSNGH